MPLIIMYVKKLGLKTRRDPLALLDSLHTPHKPHPLQNAHPSTHSSPPPPPNTYTPLQNTTTQTQQVPNLLPPRRRGHHPRRPPNLHLPRQHDGQHHLPPPPPPLGRVRRRHRQWGVRGRLAPHAADLGPTGVGRGWGGFPPHVGAASAGAAAGG
jgi:hypothetical protein